MTPRDETWARLAPIHAEILAHPFLTGLADGSLPRPTFIRYLLQDGLFLAEYARALAHCGARAADVATLTMFCGHASEAIAAERELHERLLASLEIDPSIAEDTPASPTCTAYTSFLLRSVAFGERHEALGAILPCYWIYWEVGRELVRRGSPDPVYEEWIRTYADPGFQTAVEGCLDAYGAALAGLPAPARESALAHAVTAARYEWMFWDSAFRGEEWPIAPPLRSEP